MCYKACKIQYSIQSLNHAHDRCQNARYLEFDHRIWAHQHIYIHDQVQNNTGRGRNFCSKFKPCTWSMSKCQMFGIWPQDLRSPTYTCTWGHSYLIQWFSIQSRAIFEESGGRSNKKIIQNCYFIFWVGHLDFLLAIFLPTWQFWDCGGVKLESLCNFSIEGCQWTVNCLLGG